jgi:hypothetical protein
VITGPATLCDGDTVMLSANTPFVSVAWSTGASTKTIAVARSGIYTVTVTGDSGCSSTSEPFTVTAYKRPAPRIVALGPVRFCEGDSTLLEVVAGAGDAPYRALQWSSGDTAARITVQRSGEYRAIVTDANGCTAQATASVTVLPLPNATITRRGDTLESSPGAAYQWYRNEQPIDGATARMYLPTVAGLYTVRVVSADGCDALSAGVSAGGQAGVDGTERALDVRIRHTAGSAELFIDIPPIGTSGCVSITLLTMTGTVVYDVEETVCATSCTHRVDMSRLPQGAYLVAVAAGDRRGGAKIMHVR